MIDSFEYAREAHTRALDVFHRAFAARWEAPKGADIAALDEAVESARRGVRRALYKAASSAAKENVPVAALAAVVEETV